MIIGFVGKKRTGKTTATKIVDVLYPGRVTKSNFKEFLLGEIRYYFPDVIEYYCLMNGMSEEQVLEEKPGCIRQLLQNFGTNLRRADNNDYWVNGWKSLRDTDAEDIVVADDVRFLNEAKAIKDLGGFIIKLEGNTSEEGDTHISETEMESISPDYIVKVEKGDIKSMIDDLDVVLKEITHREHEESERT